jgi:NodT family efflux transporter outer membrane factor (OMF) lipoprotein
MTTSRFFPPLAAIAACACLAACKTATPPDGGDILSDAARSAIPPGWQNSASSGAVVPGWVRSFNDPTLERLVADAVARNPDLAAAAARVEASRAAVRVAASSLYPAVGLKVLGERQGRRLSGDLDLGIDPPDLGGIGVENSGGSFGSSSIEKSSRRDIAGIGIGAAWEADVWGRLRSKRAAALSDSLAAEADLEFARQSLAATVARAYFSVIEASQQAANAGETLALYDDYLKLVELRKEQGFASDFDIAQLKTRISATQDSVHIANSARAQAIRAIEVVSSRYPAGKLSTRNSLPTQPRPVPAGLPSELLERRPDLIAAERRFAAAFHRASEARAARLPRFALSGLGGLGTADLNGVGTLDALTWSLAGGITQPIFLGGALKAVENIRSAEQRASAMAYTATALRAFSEVEDGLSHEHFLALRESAIQEMVANSAKAVELGRSQFEEGQADMFNMLILAGDNLAARAELTRIRASRLRERANLHLALGGSFQDRHSK